jgi:transposase
MRPRKQFSESEKESIRNALKRSGTVEEFKRLQAVYLRMELGLRAEAIGKLLGLHTASVWRIHSNFFKDGAEIFVSGPRGGRRHFNLSIAEEESVLKPFLKKAENSGIITVSSVQGAYEEKLGRAVPSSTVYRALGRHGWRKLVPRPSHPKSDKEAQESFKKTSKTSSFQKSGTLKTSAKSESCFKMKGVSDE